MHCDTCLHELTHKYACTYTHEHECTHTPGEGGVHKQEDTGNTEKKLGGEAQGRRGREVFSKQRSSKEKTLELATLSQKLAGRSISLPTPKSPLSAA